MDDLIAKAVTALRSSPASGDAEIHRLLVANGIEPAIAARLVEFLPMAYCRLLLERLGARFSRTLQRRLEDGQVSEERYLSSEPVWDAVVAFARNEANRGVKAKDLVAVASRSAEFDAANQLLNKGSKLENVAFAPTLLTWPEGGPATES